MKTVKLNEKAVKGMFENCKHQSSIILGLHKMVYKKTWKTIEKLSGFCKCNRNTSLAIGKLCIEFDQKHSKSFPGGAWLNYGFSSGDPECNLLHDWEVIPAPYTT